MNDAAPDADTRQSRRAFWPLQQQPLDVVPPLASLAAITALVAMILNQLVLPGLGAGARAAQFEKLAQAARFFANLAVTSGLITLISCVSWALLGRPRQTVRRQMFVFVSAGVLVHIALNALLFDPLAASRTQIYFGVAAANIIGMALGSAAVSSTRGPFVRLLTGIITALAALNLATVVLDFAPDAQVDPWMRRAVVICKGTGEVVYLVLVVAAFPLLVPRGLSMRTLTARALGFAVLVFSFFAQLSANRALHADYGLLVYSAQRVSLWIDRYPLAYAIPFCLLLSATVSGLIAGGAVRVQGAAGMLLIFSAGYATRAPGRLLSLACGFMLLTRALIAFSEFAPFRTAGTSGPVKRTVPPSDAAKGGEASVPVSSGGVVEPVQPAAATPEVEGDASADPPDGDDKPSRGSTS